MPKQPLILFLHIPKTAGTTLQRIIEREYKPEAVFQLQNPGTQQSIEKFNHLPEKRRARIRVLHGHVCYGIHESILEPSTYLAVLREPIDRVISHYYFIRRRPKHLLYETLTSQNVSLEDFVRRQLSLEVDNGQVRQLSGVPDVFKTVPYSQCTREMLEMAKQNLRRHFPIVGLTEDFDRTLILLKHEFRWRKPFYLNENVTRDRPKVSAVSRELLALISEHNKLDQELYIFAQKLFQAQVVEYGSSFENEVRNFQSLNKTYGRILAFVGLNLNKARKARIKAVALWDKSQSAFRVRAQT